MVKLTRLGLYGLLVLFAVAYFEDQTVSRVLRDHGWQTAKTVFRILFGGLI